MESTTGPVIASCIAAAVLALFISGAAFVVVTSRPPPQKPQPQPPPQKPTNSIAKTPPTPAWRTISTDLVGWNVDVAVAYLKKSQPDKDVIKMHTGQGWTKDLRVSRIRVSYDPETNLVVSQPQIG